MMEKYINGSTSGGTEYLMSPHTHTRFGIEKNHIFQYLRFTVIFTGLIRTTCSHSLPIFRYSEHVQYTEDESIQKSEPQRPSFFNPKKKRPHPKPHNLSSRLRRSQLVALNIFISQLPPPRPIFLLANNAHGYISLHF